MHTIFGFGSLLYKPSLLNTAPNATTIRPAYLVGFTRSFSFWDSVGYTSDNVDVAGEPMCALDLARTNDLGTRVNGITFQVDGVDLKRLLAREEGMNLIQVTAYDYDTEKVITNNCYVFYGNKNDGEFVFEGAAQNRYLGNYLKGAQLLGERFYEELLETTFIGSQPLSRLTKLTSQPDQQQHVSIA